MTITFEEGVSVNGNQNKPDVIHLNEQLGGKTRHRGHRGNRVV